MACGREDFTCDPFAEFPCVWFGASENSVVKTRFVDYREVSDLTPHFGGLGFGDFIIIKTTGHSFCFGIPQYLRDILSHEPWFTVFHQNTDFSSVEVEDFRRFNRSSIRGCTVRDTPSSFFRYSVIPLQHSKRFPLPFLQGFCGHSIYPLLLNNRWF